MDLSGTTCLLFLQGVFFQERSLFASFLKISTVDVKPDKSRVASCFLELPHFPQAFQSDVDQLQVLFFHLGFSSLC